MKYFLDLLSTSTAKLVGLAIIVLVAFTAGWKINGWRHDAASKQKLDAIIEQAKVQAEQDRKAIADLQAVKQRVITKEVIRYAKIKDATDGRVCFANWDAVRLWNAALSGQEPMPKDTAGTASPTGNAGATDTEVLENLNANAARWERLREQMNAIIEWDKKTFGENK